MSPRASVISRKSPFILLIVCFSIGILSGYLFAVYACDVSVLSDYLLDYCALAADRGLRVSFWTAIRKCFFFPLATLLFSMTVGFGSILTLFLFAFRGFILAYTAASVGLACGRCGFWIFSALFAVTLFLELPCAFLFGCEFFRVPGIRASKSDETISYRTEILLVGIGFMILAAALQMVVVPDLFSAICRYYYT